MLIGPDVIRLNIGKNPDLKGESRRPVQHQPLGGNLHHGTVAARVQHFPEILLYQQRFRRGVCGGDDMISDDGLDGADQPHLIAGIFQDGLHHVGGGGFSLGSGDADHLQLISRIAVPGCRDDCHGITAVLHLNHGHIPGYLHRILTHNHFCSLGRHLRREVVAIRHSSFDAKEQGILPRLPGIRHNPADFPVHGALQACIIQTFQQLC